MKLYIYPVTDEGRGRGPLLATVTEGGEVEPDDSGVREHVERVMREGLHGQALRDRLKRSYTNGYLVAEWR